jgi:hypothetical protein
MECIFKKKEDIDENNLWVRFDLKDWWYDDYDILVSFEEFDDRYEFKNNMSSKYTIEKKDIVWDPKFYELRIKCWNCDNKCLYSERINKKWIHTDMNNLKRDRDFCSNNCVDEYCTNENFQLI